MYSSLKLLEDIEDRFGLGGRLVGGRFDVETAIARGGSGLVYRARHVELDTRVALKVLVVPEHLRGVESSLVERFRQEARTLARLAHPSVVRVLDVGTLDAADGVCIWMALEWLDGVTLDAHLQSDPGSGRSPREVLALLTPVLEAMACAHARGIAHRDLKPSNIMVSPAAGGGLDLRVLDFGIAKAMLPDESPGTGLTETRNDLSAFSLPYAAPEQVGRMRTGPWTDVHALGLLLTEILTRRAPFDTRDSFALYAAIMAPQRPTPARGGVDVGPWEPIVARALALHPSARFASAQELLDALRASVDEAQQVWAGPDAIEQAPRTPRPVPRAWIAAGALVLPVLALAVWGPTQRPRVVAPTAAAPSVAAPTVATPSIAAPTVAAIVEPPAGPPAPRTTPPPPVPAQDVPGLAAVGPRAPRTASTHPARVQRTASVVRVRPPTPDPDDILME